MARNARVEFEGAVYHVLDRGDRREAICKDEADRRRFLETLGEACARIGRRIHAFVYFGLVVSILLLPVLCFHLVEHPLIKIGNWLATQRGALNSSGFVVSKVKADGAL